MEDIEKLDNGIAGFIGSQMLKIDKEMNLLIKLTKDLYQKSLLPDVDVNEINIDKFIHIALKNNVLYYVAKKMIENISLEPSLKERFETIVSKGDSELVEIERSIDEVQKHFKEHVIFKTYRGENFPRIGNDIDVLAKYQNLDFIKNDFIAMGYHTGYDDPKEKSVGLLRAGQKKIHLHGAITWCWTEYMDEEIIYQNPRNVIYNGQRITIPNVNADFLIHIAHMNFEPLHMIYSELLYLFNLVPEIDFDIILRQTKKYNWQKTLLRTLNLMNNFHQNLYGKLLTAKVEFTELELTNLVFPYVFSRKHIILTILEKRLFIYPLTKLFKVIRVLLTRNTYRYIDSPERRVIR